MKKFALISLGLSLAALSMTGCGGAKKIATVNGVAITEEEYLDYIQFKPKVNVVLANGNVAEANVAETLGYQAMQDLVRNKLILQLAADDRVSPTEKDVNDEIEFQKKRNPGFLANLTSLGLTLKQIKQQIEVDLARERILSKGVEVSNLEIDNYIQKNKAQFIRPATSEMLWIFVKSANKKKLVDQDLLAGQAFGTVASRYSEFDGGKEGGKFPTTVIDQMNPIVKDKVANVLRDNQTSDWLQLQDGFAKFYVEKYTKPSSVKIDDSMRSQIKRQIAVQQGMGAIDLDSRLLERMKKSKIDVSKAGLKERWKQAMDKLEAIQLDGK